MLIPIIFVFISVIKCDDSVPVKYGIRLSAESSLRALKRDLAQLCDISKSKLLIVEIANSLIRRIYQNDDKLCGDTVLNLYAYELPFSLETVSTYSSIEYGKTLLYFSNYNNLTLRRYL